jgi:hypothetical protein
MNGLQSISVWSDSRDEKGLVPHIPKKPPGNGHPGGSSVFIYRRQYNLAIYQFFHHILNF